jgi:hypothetical protein
MVDGFKRWQTILILKYIPPNPSSEARQAGKKPCGGAQRMSPTMGICGVRTFPFPRKARCAGAERGAAGEVNNSLKSGRKTGIDGEASNWREGEENG